MSRRADVAEGTGQKRSGRLTFVSAVTGFYAILALLSGLAVITLNDFAGDFLPPGLGGIMVVLALVAVLFGVLFVAVAYGVWHCTSWGRSLGFAVHVPPVVGSIPLLVGGLLWVVPSLVLSGSALYFLYDERAAFQ
ncbi:hypothetical protein [Halorhabdus sp. BNX81]|uniref:hypothetical protein n=1 Tax=Halorhabdus sp. BNX81 TaxID=2980181 RepID=UPI0023DD5E0A|nr:hypothetical protein [Halorhabdus sp. BNX81]WEL20192.1 Uncharacterized membrane protein, DUF2068 [Halorhabdus sp. BNX81]